MKLNLGCGQKMLKGYLNVDTQDLEHNEYEFVRSDCRNLSFLANESVDEILADGLVEHICPLNLKETFYEWNRVLVLGGTVIIISPDFDKIVKTYSEIKNILNLDELMLFLNLNYAILNTNQNEGLVKADRHRSIITKRFLELMLCSEGFKFESLQPAEDRGKNITTQFIFSKVSND
jgi:ubiquinone/menaquinone biosynthesis C-methylase UbiE